MAHEMSTAEWQEFVSAGTRVAQFAVVRKSGAPYIVPVWFVLDGIDIVLMTSRQSIKGKALRREARVALCIDDDRPPFAFVTIQGNAKIVDDPSELLQFAVAIGGRYMGPERAERFARRNAVLKELLVRVHPTKVTAIGGSAA